MEDRLKILSQDFKASSHDIEDIRHDIKDVRHDIKDIRHDIGIVRHDIEGLLVRQTELEDTAIVRKYIANRGKG